MYVQAIKGVLLLSSDWKEIYTLESFAPSSSTLLEVVVYNHNTLRPDSIIGEQQDPSYMTPSKIEVVCRPTHSLPSCDGPPHRVLSLV